MPNVPLSITLASSQNPVDVVRASLGLPEPSPPDLGEFNKDWKPTLQPKPTIIGDISIDDFVRAYPDKPPAKISRDASGDVMVIGGGVLEQLYLYYWANRGSGKGLESVVRDIEEQRLSRNLESAELGTSSESEMLSPETLAAEVETQLYPSQQAGAEALISDAIESWYLKG